MTLPKGGVLVDLGRTDPKVGRKAYHDSVNEQPL